MRNVTNLIARITQEAADVILVDDNFSTILAAVEEGALSNMILLESVILSKLV